MSDLKGGVLQINRVARYIHWRGHSYKMHPKDELEHALGDFLTRIVNPLESRIEELETTLERLIDIASSWESFPPVALDEAQAVLHWDTDLWASSGDKE